MIIQPLDPNKPFFLYSSYANYDSSLQFKMHFTCLIELFWEMSTDIFQIKSKVFRQFS